MEDSELNAIRAARLAQMQKSAGSTGVCKLNILTKLFYSNYYSRFTH
jgi:DNA-binding TFAR19-related protein (PDSD5 family)